MDNAGLFLGLFSLSSCFWLLLYLYSNISIKDFIVSRYKSETNLIDTAFFKKHATFIRDLPDFLSAGFFGTHLLMCVWGWRIYGNKKMFEDIETPNYVTQHFSAKEIRRTKKMFSSGLIFFLHAMLYLLLKIFWSDSL